MSFVIDLPQPVEARIAQEAQKAGISPIDLVTEIVRRNFSAEIDTEEQKRLNVPSIALLQSWLIEAEKPRSESDNIQAEEDQKDLMRNLNATRREAGERLHFPDITEKS